MINVRKTICRECPFRENEGPNWLGDYTAMELHQLIRRVYFPCHMTLVDEIPYTRWPQSPLCRGSLVYLKKSCGMHDDPEIEDERKSISAEECKKVKSVPEFLKQDEE